MPSDESSLDALPPAQWLGRLGYRWALRLQHTRREAVLDRRAPEVVWLLEHPPVITLGRRGGTVLHADGVEVVRTERGGLATWHGPGQLVGYLVMRVADRGLGVRRFVDAVESGIIDWLIEVGVAASRRPGFPGVWVGRDKICAVGFHFRRGVSMHGFALNLGDVGPQFEAIVPCGIADAGVTSLYALGHPGWAPHAAAAGVGASIRAALAAQCPGAPESS